MREFVLDASVPPWLASLSAVDLEPDAVVVARVKMTLTADQATVLKTQLERVFPGHRVAIVTFGIELEFE